MISFENTEIAFQSKSDQDLNRAYWLFKIVGSPSMVKLGKWGTNAALSAGLPIKGIIKNTIFKQFCGGESIDDCQQAIELLNKYGIGTILDYSVEGKTSEEDFDETVNEIIRTIEKAKGNPAIPFAVFKVTGISRFAILEKANNPSNKLSDIEQAELGGVIDRINQICSAGYKAGVPVFIDAEETWIQDTIDSITLDMMRKYNTQKTIVYNTLQMYRHDRIEYLERMMDLSKKENFHYGVKLVRGAYMEKERLRASQNAYPSPIQPDKNSCDTDFNKALEITCEHIDHAALCAGSHNEKSAIILVELMEKYSIEPNDSRICFAQLLGMSDHISYNMAYHGYNVAKYVPYGPIKEVMPYLLRRADENTSVAGQTGRELNLIIKERKRRASK
ncbi:MAG: proline dehydrogenase family protein [Crocinitomicaceae bacterium]|jgi:proline dehydrogenase|nr:proline dehydrogenase family protein [Crocinitomicaceae bacterium]MDP4865714.1 proline dehydrogenase family protein [Crocinitomicaceae bacterium]MDP5012053.1 proline dehydrogenase family protein [Crocinitomicaceae bacterium]